MWSRVRKSLFVLLAVAASSMVSGAPASAETRTLRGTVMFRERMALPPTAVAEVKLLDVSRADAKARIIGQTRVPAGPGSPIRYVIAYDARQIRPGLTYALQARIVDRGRLVFINTSRHTVFGPGRDETDILVQRVR